MNNDPFAHGQPPEFLPDEATLPQQVSTLAILSLVLALTCLLAPIGLILGGVALISIARSEGRLRGTGLAVSGIIVGLICSMLLIGCVVGMNYATNMGIVPADQAMQAIEAGDWNAARAEMSGLASTATDDQLTQFRDGYQADYGGYQSMPRGILKVLSGSRDPRLQSMSQVMQAYPDVYSLPVVSTFDNGTAPIIVVMDTTAGQPMPENLAIVRQDGSLLWLVDPASGP